ncbi:MAG: hypothetical protein R8G66_20810 [Cytophagales bacterium]|nr:hypothetical protein [Cytophagales bacterium]
MISLISGFYPAMILARFDIVKSLKGIQKARKGKAVMQSLLVVQFSISTAMIICMFIFHRQLNFILNADHGQNIEEVVLLNTPDEVAPKTTRYSLTKSSP